MNMDFSNKHVVQLHVSKDYRLPINKIMVKQAAIMTLTDRTPEILIGKYAYRDIQHFTVFHVGDTIRRDPIYLTPEVAQYGYRALSVTGILPDSLIVSAPYEGMPHEFVLLAQSGISGLYPNKAGHGADFVQFIYDSGNADVRLGFIGKE